MPARRSLRHDLAPLKVELWPPKHREKVSLLCAYSLHLRSVFLHPFVIFDLSPTSWVLLFHSLAGIVLTYSFSATRNQCRMNTDVEWVLCMKCRWLASGMAWQTGSGKATTFALSGGWLRYGIGSTRKPICPSRIYRHFLWQWIVPRDKNGSSTQRLREIVVQMHCNCRLTWILFLTIFNPIILRSSPPSLSNILRTERSLMAATYADQR